MDNKNKHILCVAGCLLGNKTFTRNLKAVLDERADFQVDYIFIEGTDYAAYPAPAWRKRLGMTSEILYIIANKLAGVDFSRYDLVVAQGFEVGWAVNRHVRDIPCIMFNDATPTASHELIANYKYHGWLWKWRSRLLIFVYRTFFGKVFCHIDRFFPRTSWCGRSLVRDFHVNADKVSDGTIGIDLSVWARSAVRENAKKISLLFVGNDFMRKGGDFLLKIFKRLGGRADLTIISNDPFLDSGALPDGVKVLKNIPYSELPAQFCKADIFIFPTYKDHLGLSQIEALASGLPLLSRDTGGVADVVRDGYNGYLMPYSSTENDWVEKILYLADHPDDRKRMGQNSRKLAEEKFSMDRFKKTVSDAIYSLTAQGADD